MSATSPLPTYGIIGSGRLGRHLAHYFSLANIKFNTWARANNNTAELRALSENVDVIILAITDDAIEQFINQHAFLHTKTLIHCSGSLTIDSACGMHPLLSFGKELYNYEFYTKIPFITDENGADFKEIFPQLPNPNFRIAAEHKAYYHALCVMGGNFTSILWDKLFTEFRNKLNLPNEVANFYLQAVHNNITADHASAITGPLARGDNTTIQRNLEALEQDTFKPIYQAFVDVFLKPHSKR